MAARFLIESKLYDGSGATLATATSTGHTASLAWAVAKAWASGQLALQADPDAYVEHTIEEVE